MLPTVVCIPLDFASCQGPYCVCWWIGRITIQTATKLDEAVAHVVCSTPRGAPGVALVTILEQAAIGCAASRCVHPFRDLLHVLVICYTTRT